MAKYTTLTELSEAIRRKELDGRDYCLMIDKGGSDLTLCRYSHGDDDPDASADECKRIFKREYGNPVEELLKLAGINSERC
jgi:hypothetical protein